jgi:hypothetical protein
MGSDAIASDAIASDEFAWVSLPGILIVEG